MNEPYVDRWHRNGAVAKVCYSSRSGAYGATMFPPAKQWTTTTVASVESSDLKAAQSIAGRMSHPDCDGRCGPIVTRGPD